jgi:hypothetical protein
MKKILTSIFILLSLIGFSQSNVTTTATFSSGQVPYANGAHTVLADANFTWDATNHVLLIQNPSTPYAGGIKQYTNSDFIIEPQSSAAGLQGLSIWSYQGVEKGVVKINDATGEMRIGTTGTSYFPTFYEAGTEYGRINTNGKWLFGSTSQNGAQTVQVTGGITSDSITLSNGAANNLIAVSDANGKLNWKAPWKSMTTGTPTCTVGTGAGTGGSCLINGDDYGGYILITTGTAPAANATVVTVTYSSSMDNAYPMLCAAGSGSLGIMNRIYITAATGPAFQINDAGTALSASSQYPLYYSTHPY